MSHHLYAYGTLQFSAIITRLVGRKLSGQAAGLSGYARYRVADQPYPAIIEAVDAEVSGVVYLGLAATELERLDTYEGNLYSRRELPVWMGNTSILAFAYVLSPEHAHRLSREPWDIANFERDHLASYLDRL